MNAPVFVITGLNWDTNGRWRCLRPDPAALAPGQTAVVAAADASEARKISDIMLGLDWSFNGRISIDGQEITMRNPEEREIGLVPAGAGLLPHLTVERNLALAARANRPPSDYRGRIRFMARRMGIEGILTCHPHELAHDERLHVALARIMCRHHPVRVILIEDRFGYDPCHGAVSAALGDDPTLAVLVVTDDKTRVAGLASPGLLWEVGDADAP